MLLLVLLVLVLPLVHSNSTECPNIKTSLNSIRKKRHLLFPKGSNIVLSVSLLQSLLTHVPSGWNAVMEIDLLYPLPDEEFSKQHRRRKLHHQQKRDFWERLESAINLHNLNGRACVLRSVCEAQGQLAPPGKSLVHDLLRAVFMPQLHEDDFRSEMDESYNELLDNDFCEQANDCPISILNSILAFNRNKF
ncbi:uncharacterized protein LOC126967596 [Leptidea sinapis]|uniref:Uncharacterized protein n=1 Tax=Leptidea sinapis TaxID=189913 RepID=A0A5E4QJ51_9NEOP|nr:uncharacterized protein LOC126967596 [Leptidea sinapis]VVC97721.1 unnamed protein product [Leptidea sinapis]